MNIAATLGRIRCIAGVPLQRRRSQGSLRSLWFTIAFAMSVPALLTLWAILGSSHEARIVAGAFTIAIGGIVTLGAWAVFLAGLHAQASFTTAPLVPAHTRHLGLTMATGVGGVCAVFGILGGLFFGQVLLGALGALVLLALVTAVLSRVWLAAVLIVAVIAWQSRPSPGASFVALFQGLLAHRLLVVPVVAAICVLVLAAAAPASRRAARFRRLAPQPQQGARVEREALGRDVQPPASRNGLVPDWWRTGRLPPEQPDALLRALAVLPLSIRPALAWGRQWRAWLALLGMAALMRLDFFGSHADLLFLMIAGQGLVLLLGDVLVVRTELARTRQEQALMSLIPGMPSGAALSRALALRLSGSYAVGLARGVLAFAALRGILVWSGAELSWFESATALAALPLAGVPLAVLLWSNWASVAALSVNQLLVFLAVLSLAGFAMLAPHRGWASLGEVAVLYALPTLAWCAWRWRRMADEPASLPAGRLGA